MPINLQMLRESHREIIAQSERAVTEEAEAAARFAPQHVRDHATFKHRTHKLEQATKTRVMRIGGKARVIVSNSKKYAAAIDLGSKPHVIRPRRAKLLAFRVHGRLVFARSVNHPGNKPYRFLYRATNAAARIYGVNIQARLERIARDRH